MSKYSQKIESTISDLSSLSHTIKMINDNTKPQNEVISPITKTLVNIEKGLLNNQSVRNVLDCGVDAYKKTHNIKSLEVSSIKKIHKRDGYPLSYIFFKCLHDLDLLGEIVSHPQNISDLHNFMVWHRENISGVNFNKLHKLMEGLSDDEKYDELKLVYRLMFKTTGVRKVLHDSIYSNVFISADVQYDLESVDLDYVKYSIDDRHIVSIFVPRTSDVSQQEITEDTPNIQTIALLISTLENLAKKYGLTCPNVDLVVLYSSQKKSLPRFTDNDDPLDHLSHSEQKIDVLCCDNINSGSTFPGRSIVCWRREEFYKVLIHELFHFYKFDFFSTDQLYTQLEEMVTLPSVIGSDSLNECYTEAGAILILIIMRFLSCYLKSDRFDQLRKIEINNERFMTEFEKFFYSAVETEILFIMFQIAKVIFLFGGRSFDDYLRSNITIKQTTSFRSYFIVKLALLCNMKEYVSFMNSSVQIDSDRLIEFGELLNDSWDRLIKNRVFIKLMNEFIDLFGKLDTSDFKKWIFRTCRMSVNDNISSYVNR